MIYLGGGTNLPRYKQEISTTKPQNKCDKENLACAKPVALAEALVALILSERKVLEFRKLHLN